MLQIATEFLTMRRKPQRAQQSEIMFLIGRGREFEVVIDDQSSADHRPAVAACLDFHII
jgi:hypothetical protein